MTTRYHLNRANRRPGLGLVVLLAACIAPCASHAGNLSFLQDSPSSYFRGDDADLMMKNARAALDSSEANAKRSWSNPKTGASGFAQVTGQFTGADGAPCKQLRIGNKAGGLQGEGTYTLCKYKDRGWVFHTDAQPAS
jgi:hypothetical protein